MLTLLRHGISSIKRVELASLSPAIRPRTNTIRFTVLLLRLRVGWKNHERVPFSLLVHLIEQFENKQYPLERASAHEVLPHLMEARGLTHKDIWPLFGSKGVASEVLNGKRVISKAQAKKLAEFFHVSAELFL